MTVKTHAPRSHRVILNMTVDKFGRSNKLNASSSYTLKSNHEMKLVHQQLQKICENILKLKKDVSTDIESITINISNLYKKLYELTTEVNNKNNTFNQHVVKNSKSFVDILRRLDDNKTDSNTDFNKYVQNLQKQFNDSLEILKHFVETKDEQLIE